MTRHFYVVVVLWLGLVAGCSSVVTATHEGPIDNDPSTRTLGRKIDDSIIETKVEVNIAKAHPELESASHILVVSYNGIVLLAGQVPRQELKQLAEQVSGAVQGVRRVQNELQVMSPSSVLARSNDALLTTRIKAVMLADNAIPSTRVKVLTENGIVYMMGLLTRQEAQRATAAVQSVSGVQRVVRVFELLD